MFQLPNEIICKIYEFDGTKREKIQQSLSKIRIRGCLIRVEYITRSWFHETATSDLTNIHLVSDDDSFGCFLRNNLTDYEHIFNILSQCSCCLRHTINRPKLLPISHDDYDYYDEFAHPYNHTDVTFNCKCPCRHISRHIYRTNFN